MSIGVFGTLTVPEVIEAGPTAIAVAAQPSLGDLGYWMMTVTALFATAGATNAGLYPAAGLSEELASTGQFLAVMGRTVGGRANVGLLIVAVAVSLLAIGYDLSAIASIGSAVALMVFTLVSIGHLRIRSDNGANPWLLLLAIGTAGISLLVFVFTTLIQEPASIVALIVILLLSIGLDLWWSARRPAKVDPQAA